MPTGLVVSGEVLPNAGGGSPLLWRHSFGLLPWGLRINPSSLWYCYCELLQTTLENL